MSAIKVKATQFSGTSHVFNRSPGGLASILRNMLIDNANLKVQVASVHDFTDNSTGTASGSGLIGNLGVLPDGVVNAATATIGATEAALNTSLGKIQNACKVVTNTLNEARGPLGLPLIVCSAGTAAAADTIPALDKTNAGAAGTSTATFASAATAMQAATDSVYSLMEAANEVFVAIGVAPLGLPPVQRAYDLTLPVIGTASASANGSDAASQADVQGWLYGVAGAFATLAAAWNAAFAQSDAQPLRVIAG